MRHRRPHVLVVGLLSATLSFNVSLVRGEDDLAETARLLAILLDSGRVTIAANQALINDATRGPKGFTPDAFERQLLGTFKARANIDLHDLPAARVPESAKPLLARLVEESKKTVASYQPAINIAGIAYKGFIPATFGTETASRFRAWSGIYLKQTAPLRFLRNQKNKPDEWEALMLQKAASSQRQGQDEIVTERDDGSIRVMLPLFYSKDCLACHGEPKGERDISGYPREGGKEGELGGGIVVRIERNGLGTAGR